MLSVQAESKQHDIDYVLSVPGPCHQDCLGFLFCTVCAAELPRTDNTTRFCIFGCIVPACRHTAYKTCTNTIDIRCSVNQSHQHMVCCIVRHDANDYVTPAVKKSCVPIQTFCQSSSAYAATLEPPTKKFGLNLDKSPTLLAVFFFLLLACALMRAFMSARLALFINRNCPSLAKPARHPGDQFFCCLVVSVIWRVTCT